MRSAGSASNRKKHPACEYGYTVVYQRMPEGSYSVVVPAIPEICTFGETLPEARRMAKDAVRCFLESALKTGEAIPTACHYPHSFERHSPFVAQTDAETGGVD